MIPLPPMAHFLAFGRVALNAAKPPTLEDQLAAAREFLREKTAVAAPFIEAAKKAEAELAPVQAAHLAAQQEAAGVQKNFDGLGAEIKQLTDSRAAKDAERAKLAVDISQVQEAQPLVAEALRHLTEAVGKAPTDASLTDAQRQLTEKLKAMEGNVIELQTKTTELTTAVNTADASLKDLNVRLEAARRQLAAATERITSLEAQSRQLATVVDAARKAAEPAQAEVMQAMRDVERWQKEIAFRDQMETLTAELTSARNLAAARQADLDRANAQLTAAKSAVDAATAKRDEASRSIETVQARIEAAQTARPAPPAELERAEKATER